MRLIIEKKLSVSMKKILVTASGILIVFLLSAQDPGIIRDIDGNEYQVVRIGQQEWMAENLRTTRFNNGTNIPLITGNKDWSESYSPAYSWYKNNEKANKNTYGALYNWYAVKSGKLCPEGWHVPTDAEWSEITDFLGGRTVAGGKMKSTGAGNKQEEVSESELDKEKPTYVPEDNEEKEEAAAADTDNKTSSGWNSPNTGATNESGFSALPGGQRTPDAFDNMGRFGFWWTATEASPGVAWYRLLYNDHSTISRMTISKTDGHSVRCIRD